MNIRKNMLLRVIHNKVISGITYSKNSWNTMYENSSIKALTSYDIIFKFDVHIICFTIFSIQYYFMVGNKISFFISLFLHKTYENLFDNSDHSYKNMFIFNNFFYNIWNVIKMTYITFVRVHLFQRFINGSQIWNWVPLIYERGGINWCFWNKINSISYQFGRID